MRIVFVFLCVVFFAGSLGAQEEVDLNSLPEDSSSKPAPAPSTDFTFNLYADFDLQYFSPGTNFTIWPQLTFLTNHREILVQASYKDLAKFYTDILNPLSVLEMSVYFDRENSIKFGQIIVPFGEFNIHHIYGGIEDNNGVFFPKIWSDLGLSYKHALTPDLGVEVYIVNGFNVLNEFEPDFGSTGTPDKKLLKAIGVQTRWDFLPGSYITGSLYNDWFDTDEILGRDILMMGLDGAVRVGLLTVSAGGVIGDIWSNKKTWSRAAWYGQILLALDPHLSIRARGGSMDPDNRVNDYTDQWDLNLALLLHFEVLDINVVYFHNQEIYAPDLQNEPNNYNSFLVKLLLAL